jgi:hypothetical protein
MTAGKRLWRNRKQKKTRRSCPATYRYCALSRVSIGEPL